MKSIKEKAEEYRRVIQVINEHESLVEPVSEDLEREAVTLRYFANLMQQDPNFEHKDWNG